MLEALKKQFAVQWKDWMGVAVVIPCTWVGGLVMYFIITRLDSDVTGYFSMGTLIAIFCTVLCVGIMGTLQLGVYFNMEVSMGCTRRRFFLSHYVVSFVFCFFYLGLVILLNLAEKYIQEQLYPKLSCEIDFLPYLLKWGIPAIAATCLISGFCGALLLRYGRKAFWVLWAVWMICAVGIPQIHSATENAPNSLFGWIGKKIGWIFSGFTVNMFIGIMVVISILSLAGAWIHLRNQQVTG